MRNSRQKPDQIPPSRAKFFWPVMIVFPLVVLCGLEIILRSVNYGGNLDLVIKTKILGKEYYTLNREVARRYFLQKGIAIPEACDDIFEIEKRPNTKRIFMLGESTMAGYPFDYNATAPRLLKDRLTQLLPQYNIEVVNVGLAAVNSYTVLDFIKELVDYKPDAFIVYLGHNEFYGAMGIGSTEYLGQWRWLVNAYLQMRQLRLFLLVRDGIIVLRNLFAHEVTPRESTLMETMVREKIVRYNSREYLIAKRNFEANTKAIIAVAKEHAIPIMFSTLASNLRDQEPLLPTFSEGITTKASQHWQENADSGKSTMRSGEFIHAVQFFDKAIAVDSMNADAHFHRAKCLDTLGQFSEAKQAYVKARDYDGLRFRASSDFNDLLRAVCREENAAISDAEKTFEEQSPHGLVGSNLMFEHLHPNFEGYFLLAKTMFRSIVEHSFLVENKEWHWERNLTDEEFKKSSGVTEFDLGAAHYRIAQLTKGWPFKNAAPQTAEYRPQNKAQELAVRYVRKQIAWSQARYDLADWYVSQHNYQNACNEYNAVAKVVPYYYFPIMRMGDMYRSMGNDSSALNLYNHALEKQNSPFIHVRLGMYYFDKNRTLEAVKEFEETFIVERNGPEKMNDRDQSAARYFLGAAYGKSGNIEKAKLNLQLAIEIDPNNQEARQMLSKIPR